MGGGNNYGLAFNDFFDSMSKLVLLIILNIQGLDSKSSEQEPGGNPGPAPRNQFKDLDLAEQKKKYRCSLINLDTSQVSLIII